MVSVLALTVAGLLAQSPNQTPPPAPAMAAPPAANPGAHSSLTSAIMEQLASAPRVGAYTITANVTADGEVSLNGVVPTQELADQAVAVVKGVSGVTSVTSQILVNRDPFAPAAAAPAPSGAPTAASLDSAESGPQAQVTRALDANPRLRRVSGVVYDHQLILIGTVTSNQDRDLAARLAQKALPGYLFTNTVWVNPHPSAPPPMIPR
ncbi:MAG: BON domain-containing protein [Terriglobales bacterium]